MNNERRKIIFSAIQKLNTIEAQLEEVLGELEPAKEDEEAFLDNMPDNLKCGERFESLENGYEQLESACVDLEVMKDNVSEIIESLQETMG